MKNAKTFLVLVEDQDFKAQNIICVLEKEGIEYIQCRAQNPSLEFISKNAKDIDGIILDLGLPLFDDSSKYDSMAGFEILDELNRLELSIPVLINSEQLVHIDEEKYPFVFKDRMFRSNDLDTLRCFIKSLN